MKKILMLLFCLIIMMGCQRSLLPYTDEEAKQFEEKLEKADVDIKEVAYPDGSLYEKGSAKFLGMTIKIENIDFGDYFYFTVHVNGLDLNAGGFKLYTVHKADESIFLETDYQQINKQKKWKLFGGVEVDGKSCYYADYEVELSEKKCNESEIKKIEDKEKNVISYLNDIGVSQEDLFRYVAWYAKKGLPAYSDLIDNE